MSNTEWQVKNITTFTGMEGPGFNCSLYRNGKRVAFVIDDATGGEVDFNWHDAEAKKAIEAHCKTLPLWGSEFGGKDEFPVLPGAFVSGLVDETLTDRHLRKHCKTKILFRQSDDDRRLDEGVWRTIKGQFTKSAVASMKKRYGEDVNILNFQYGDPA